MNYLLSKSNLNFDTYLQIYLEKINLVRVSTFLINAYQIKLLLLHALTNKR